MSRPRMHTCIHEAGHRRMASLHGGHGGWIEAPRGKKAFTHCWGNGTNVHSAQIHIAGYVAEDMFHGSCWNKQHVDWTRAVDDAAQAGWTMDQIIRKTKEDLKPQKAVILALARALEDRDELSEVECDRIEKEVTDGKRIVRVPGWFEQMLIDCYILVPDKGD